MKQPKQKICRRCKTDMNNVEPKLLPLIKNILLKSVVYYAFVILIATAFKNDILTTVLIALFGLYCIAVVILYEDDYIEMYQCPKCGKTKAKVSVLGVIIDIIISLIF